MCTMYIMLPGCTPGDNVPEPHSDIIFRGPGRNILASERAAYNKTCHLFCQLCAWADATFMNAWAVILQVAPALCNDKSRLLFLDSQTPHKDEDYLKALRERNQADVHFLPRRITNMLQPLDAKTRKISKDHIAQSFDK